MIGKHVEISPSFRVDEDKLIGTETGMAKQTTEGGITNYFGPRKLLDTPAVEGTLDKKGDGGVIPDAEKLFNIFEGDEGDLKSLVGDKDNNVILLYSGVWCKHCYYEVKWLFEEAKSIKRAIRRHRVDLEYMDTKKYKPPKEKMVTPWLPVFMAYKEGRLSSVLYGPVNAKEFIEFIIQTFQE